MIDDKPLHELSIGETGRLLRTGHVTSTQITEHLLARIGRIDPKVHAFIQVTAESALAEAKAADRAFAKGHDAGPLQGVPYALKDVFDARGIATTCHSKLRLDYKPAADCAVVERLRKQGAVLLGKLAMHEFALGGPSFDLPFPPARNPWNLEHVTGGSSSGSAAAVAAGLTRIAMGSDTGGSIRGPAAYCGTIGLKPTYGRVSRRGVFPLSYSLDHCGPVTWSVEDAAITLQAIAGFDPLDLTSADLPVPDYCGDLKSGVEGLRFGVPRNLFSGPNLSSETLTAFDQAVNALAKLGATIEEVELPDFELFVACGRIIMYSESFAIHEHRLRTRPLDFGKQTFARIALGAFLTAADLTQAMRMRRMLSAAVNSTLKAVDALVTASTVTPAPRFDAGPSAISAAPTQSIPFNVSGNPAMSIPTGFSKDGLPLSMQIVGRPFDELTVLRIGAAFEAVCCWHNKRPAVAN